MKAGDRVTKSPMWKYDKAIGTVLKITTDGYTVVKWDGINGQWHYTKEQTEKLEIRNDIHEVEISERQDP